MLDGAIKESFRTSLFQGHYSLLLGSGITLSSCDSMNNAMPNTESLRARLAGVVGANERASLAYIAQAMTENQIAKELTLRFRDCKPNDDLYPLSKYVWKRVNTFNVDNLIESVYKSNSAQTPVPVTWKSQFVPDTPPDELLLIHLHGFALEPQDGYVFSYSDYAKVTSADNPWMLTLAQTLATEAFIVAGTSLSEPDLAHYMSFRSASSQRRDLGPSIFIEPFPDGPLRRRCAELGFILIEAKFGDFLQWLSTEFSTPPRVDQIYLQEAPFTFSAEPSVKAKARFFRDFQPIRHFELEKPIRPSSYIFGQEPTWDDIRTETDIKRGINGDVEREVRKTFEGGDAAPYLVLLAGQAGQGKTTILKRVSHELARKNYTVFYHNTLGKIDVDAAVACLKLVRGKAILVVDSYADHVDQLEQILDIVFESSQLAVLAGERAYRLAYIMTVVENDQLIKCVVPDWEYAELEQLVNLYRKYGVLSDTYQREQAAGVARQIEKSNVSIAVCQLLNDVSTLERISLSLIKAADVATNRPYYLAALATFCYSEGVRQSVLQKAVGHTFPIEPLLQEASPLQLVRNVRDAQFVRPLHALLGEAVLKFGIQDVETRLNLFVDLGLSLAPHVNRNAIWLRTPEWRLSARLFDFDDVVYPLLGELADDLYSSVAEGWQWNSRFWEQRALCVLRDDVDLALKYARTAIGIEDHPLPKTTYAKVLLAKAKSDLSQADSLFVIALKELDSAIKIESSRRIAVHPYVTLLNHVIWFIETHGSLPIEVREIVTLHVAGARRRFGNDKAVLRLLNNLDAIWPQ